MQHRIERLYSLAGGTVVVTAPVDLEYLTGLPLSAGIVIAGQQSVLLVDGRYIEVAQRESAIPAVLGGVKELPQYLEGQVFFDASTMTVAQLEQMQAKSPDLSWQGIPRLLQKVRAVKDDHELKQLRAAAQLAGTGLEYLQGQLVEGVTEQALARDLEIFWLQQGGEGLSFSPIVAFGAHSSCPHHHPTDRPLQKGEPVLFDFGVQLGRYHSDMTRVLFFGQVSEEMHNIYNTVREALHEAQEQCHAGIKAGELDRVARDVIARAGYGDYFCHSLGHGVGLEVHEWPVLRQGALYGETALEENMVVTIEPGIYLPGLGGVRLENTVIVQEFGCEVITPSMY